MQSYQTISIFGVEGQRFVHVGLRLIEASSKQQDAVHDHLDDVVRVVYAAGLQCVSTGLAAGILNRIHGNVIAFSSDYTAVPGIQQ